MLLTIGVLIQIIPVITGMAALHTAKDSDEDSSKLTVSTVYPFGSHPLTQSFSHLLNIPIAV
jgi:hypothetical protein